MSADRFLSLSPNRRTALFLSVKLLGASFINAACGSDQQAAVVEPTKESVGIKVIRIPQELIDISTPEAVIDISRRLTEEYSTLNKRYSTEELDNYARIITLQKIHLIKEQEPGYPILTRGDIVRVSGQDFSLTLDSPNFVVAAALVDLHFKEKLQLDTTEDSYAAFVRRESAINNLLWLRENLEIRIEDAPPFARTEDLEKIAIMLRTLKESGIGTLPTRATISSYKDDQVLGFYVQRADTLLLQLDVTNPASIAVAKSFGKYMTWRNHDIFFGYDDTVKSATSTIKTAYKQPSMRYTNDYGVLIKPDDDFTFALYDFIMEGERLRKRIAYAQYMGYTAEAQILTAKTKYLKEVLGKEFSINGQEKVIYPYQSGDVVWHDSWDKERPYTFLRPRPTLAIDPNWPFVPDGVDIAFQLLNQPPQTISDHQKREATTFRNVLAGRVIPSGEFIPTKNPAWVSQEWFGGKTR